MGECEFMHCCGFIDKYNASLEPVCHLAVQLFCRGAKREQCARLAYRHRHGIEPTPDMLPTGTMLLA